MYMLWKLLFDYFCYLFMFHKTKIHISHAGGSLFWVTLLNVLVNTTKSAKQRNYDLFTYKPKTLTDRHTDNLTLSISLLQANLKLS